MFHPRSVTSGFRPRAKPAKDNSQPPKAQLSSHCSGSMCLCLAVRFSVEFCRRRHVDRNNIPLSKIVSFNSSALAFAECILLWTCSLATYQADFNRVVTFLSTEPASLEPSAAGPRWPCFGFPNPPDMP